MSTDSRIARALSGWVHITSSALERARLTSLQEFQTQEESDRTHSRMPTRRIPTTVMLTVFDLIVDKSLLCDAKIFNIRQITKDVSLQVVCPAEFSKN